MNIASSQNKRRAHLREQQLALFQHLVLILRHLMERITPGEMSLQERRNLQRELAGLKKATQSTRHRLKNSRRL